VKALLKFKMLPLEMTIAEKKVKKGKNRKKVL